MSQWAGRWNETGVATLLVDLDIHRRIIMRVLRHAGLAVTMEIYAKASSASTREALRKLGEALT